MKSKDLFSTDRGKTKSNTIEVPSISLPKGGGALKGIDEKFSVNAVNGTSSFSIPLPVSQARGVTPALSISYSSGAGNGIFGLGWTLSLGSIKRKTETRLPQYEDFANSDTFLFSEAEDLVPEFSKDQDGALLNDANGEHIIREKSSVDNLYVVRFYLPRIEGLYARIERWTRTDGSEIKWRVITKDNITTLFGWSPQSRLNDPLNAIKTFEWLPEFVFDDKGNCCRYVYANEDDVGVDWTLPHNRNRRREGKLLYSNLYLSKALYCNKTPYKQFGDPYPAEDDFLFETAFDYGILKANESPDKINRWNYRPDSFSVFRAGFEIRTTRLCKRVLLYHHFKGPNEYDGLVRSLNLEYDTSTAEDLTILRSATSTGHIKISQDTYSSRSLPSLDFQYQKIEWNNEVRTVSRDTLAHAPVGLDETTYQFVDLFNEGLSGILTEQASGWYYKRNLGLRPTEIENESELVFDEVKLISPKPSFMGIGAQLQLVDLDADGGKQLVSYNSIPKGFFELDDDNNWHPFTTFQKLPNTSFNNPSARLIDLNGDGKAELIISEDDAMLWFESRGRDGFIGAKRAAKSFDEETGPQIAFSDETQTIFLADMSGDGLTDIARIRNGEVCYWPNLGFGRFGSKITMDNSPVFDFTDKFNASYIKLADIDGSGTSDIIYLGQNKFSCWKNLCGNSFASTPYEIGRFPEIHPSAKVTVTDLLGNGVACIVWSSVLSKDSNAPLKYIDLMNGKKPHIMVKYLNNLGKEVSLEYTASTKFYIDDKLSGRPWITKLHFPVHCVSKITTEEKITGHKFTSSYKYHHGYYDHAEREFRGFGMIEQIDSEDFESWSKGHATNVVETVLHQEPVVTKQWFHTGALSRKDQILAQFASEYWYEEMARNEPAVVQNEKQLDDALIIPAKGVLQSAVDQLTAVEFQQALRACKSMPLRSEVFAHDAARYGNTPEARRRELIPYSVSTHNCIIELLQPKGKNNAAVFVVKESESISYHYERNDGDPRISHSLNIRFDEMGNVLESASVVYARRSVDAALPEETRAAQGKTSVIYTVNNYTNAIVNENVNRQKLVAEVKTYELKGISKEGPYYAVKHFEGILSDARSEEVLYHQFSVPVPQAKGQRRLIEHVKSIYSKDDLSLPLPLGSLEAKAIPFENYQLAYTPELLADIFGTINDNGSRITDALLNEGRFSHSLNSNNTDDANWWIRSGSTQFIAPGETVADAQKRFFSPMSYTDPFGSKTKIKYYGNYFLFISQTEDDLGNRAGVDVFNFRTLAPRVMRDMNSNLSETIADELGVVKAMAVMGKGAEADELLGLTEVTSLNEQLLIDEFYNVPDTAEGVTDAVKLSSKAKQLLQRATSRFVYDFDAYKRSGRPAVVATILREEHFHVQGDAPVQLSFEYSDGTGKVVMKKAQTEPGRAKRVRIGADNAFTVKEHDTSASDPVQLRWVGNGRTIVNNKGNAVRQYEPYFSVTHHYEDLKELVETGVSPTLYYDAAGRLIKTTMPNGTFSRSEFNPWKLVSYDTNDTVSDPACTWFVERINRAIDTALLAAGKDPAKEKSAAEKALAHSNTPTELHLDTLGRPVLQIENNGKGEDGKDILYRTRIQLDIEGNLRAVSDARELPENQGKGNTVMQYKYDMLGNKVYHKSMDAGQRWLLTNVLSKPLRTWDERDHEIQYLYDSLHRPLQNRVLRRGDDPLDNIFERYSYGESLVQGVRNDINRLNEAALQAKNLLGQPVKHYDTGGLIQIPEFDFRGKPKSTSHSLFRKYKEVTNWTDANLEADLEAESFVFKTEADALGRIKNETAPDGSVITPSYNEAGLLNSERVLLTNPNLDEIYIKNIDYNEKGQRSRIIFGNDVITTFHYDKETFRLNRLESKRKNSDLLQDWYYTYDPAGNITHIEDKTVPVVFFNNQKISGVAEYEYDALYRIRKATGRENDRELNFGKCDNWNDKAFMLDMNPGDPMSVRNYTQHYRYDAVGNILEMKHQASNRSWTRSYDYETTKNRLTATHLRDIGAPEDYTKYSHHAEHGYFSELPHLEKIDWNFKEQVVLTSRQHCTDDNIPVTTYYQYDGQGQRIRKITENFSSVNNPTKKEERIYLAGFERYRKLTGSNAGLERKTISLTDEGHRYVMVETRNDVDDGTEKRTVRFQMHNHLGSAALELDMNAAIVSYEEYHPYGTTAYQARNKSIRAAAKRYRYTGMERDEETGLSYHGARYYIPWLGRWLSADPIGITDTKNLYCYSGDNPIGLKDPSGKSPEVPPATVEDLFHFIRNQAGFEAGAEKGISFSSKAASPFGTAAHSKATGVLDAMKQMGIKGSEVIYSEVRTIGGVVDQIGGKPGGPKGSFNLDLVAVQEGKTLSKGAKLDATVGALISDIKYGGGTIASKYEALGIPLTTTNGRTVASSTQEVNALLKSLKVEDTLVKAETALSAVAKTEAVAKQASALSKLATKAAPLLTKLAPVATKLAPAAKFLGKVAGPLGIGIGVAQMATAKTTEGKIDGGITAVSSALMMSKHPVAIAAGGGLMAGQVIEKTLDVSKYSSNHGMAAYEGLKNLGVNDTASLVVGGVVTVVSTPMAITEAAVDKSIGAAKRLYRWIRD